jgi:hypothetical protein
MSSGFISFKYCINVSLYFSYSFYLVTQHRSANSFLTSTIDGGELSVSHPGHFMLWERVPCTHSQEMGWAPEVVRHFGEEINFLSHWDSNPGLSSLWLNCYTDHAIPVALLVNVITQISNNYVITPTSFYSLLV